jgi:hypothetical protein
MRSDPSDYSVIVKRRSVTSVNNWRWEIHRVGRTSSVKASDYEFVTMSSAKQAGDEALRAFIEELIKSRSAYAK